MSSFTRGDGGKDIVSRKSSTSRVQETDMLTELVLGEEAQLEGSWRVDSRMGEGFGKLGGPGSHDPIGVS